MKTARGVFYNLSESDITSRQKSNTYVFSSEFNKRRFDTRVITHREEYLNWFKLKTGYSFEELEIVADILLYSNIEKRGYMVIAKGEITTCQNQTIEESLTLHGLRNVKTL